MILYIQLRIFQHQNLIDLFIALGSKNSLVNVFLQCNNIFTSLVYLHRHKQLGIQFQVHNQLIRLNDLHVKTIDTFTQVWAAHVQSPDFFIEDSIHVMIKVMLPIICLRNHNSKITLQVPCYVKFHVTLSSML